MTFWERPNCRKKTILSMQRHRHNVKILHRLEGAKIMVSEPLGGVMAPLPPPPLDPPMPPCCIHGRAPQPGTS